MANRATLLRTLLEMTEGPGCDVPLPPHLTTRALRSLSLNVVMATRRASVPLLSPWAPQPVLGRGFISMAAPLLPRRMEYSESRTLRYSPEQVYRIVVDVERYQHFVPWCKRSKVIKRTNGDMWAQLQIGFPPIVEHYVSEVTFIPNHQVKAVCTDASLFRYLETLWRFSSCSKENSCSVEFYVSFEFKSLLHSQLAALFFDEVVKKMVDAFESRATQLYGTTGPGI
uniref:Coenzyme Q-binding protein COQ10 START domain-containing protein n=1 Tax=Denticeps clupeoides TaxID=299321 RepID=A0AAY4BGS0_9TELE